jgi:hypothetical protein
MLFSFVTLLFGSEKFGSGFLCATFGHFCSVVLSDEECTYRRGCAIGYTIMIPQNFLPAVAMRVIAW